MLGRYFYDDKNVNSRTSSFETAVSTQSWFLQRYFETAQHALNTIIIKNLAAKFYE
jgi:hypothetical protein